MNRRKRHSQVHSERWLVSYADFITLLFAFFVVLYASSQVDRAKMGALANAIEQAFQQLGTFQGNMPATPGSAKAGMASGKHLQLADNELSRLVKPIPQGSHETDLARLKQELEKTLAGEIRNHSVGLRLGPDGLVISLREMGFFNSGSATMRRDAEPVFQRIVTLLRQYDCDLRIEGHTDNVPIHTSQFHSNWELSTARATTMVQELITRYQFSPKQLSAAGYAEFHSIASNATEDGRKLNRRIDVVVLRPKSIPPTQPDAGQ